MFVLKFCVSVNFLPFWNKQREFLQTRNLLKQTLLKQMLETNKGQRSSEGTPSSSLAGVMLVAGVRDAGFLPGSPRNISRNDHDLQRIVLTAAYSYNNQSNDAFLFRPSAVRRAQRQVGHRKHIMYTPVCEVKGQHEPSPPDTPDDVTAALGSIVGL